MIAILGLIIIETLVNVSGYVTCHEGPIKIRHNAWYVLCLPGVFA